MLCSHCYNEIPKGEDYFKYRGTEQSFCSLSCLNDWMIYSNAVTIETNDDEDDEGQNDEDE